MRQLVLLALLVGLFLAPQALAGDPAEGDNAGQRTHLEQLRSHYEQMLRDAKTETAAKYFVGRLRGIEQRLAALGRADPAGVAAGEPRATTPTTAHMLRWLRGRIEQQVRMQGVSLSEVTAWTRRELPEEMFATITEWLTQGATQPDAGAPASDQAWAARKRGAWHTIGYGSGTFIVKPVGPRPPNKRAKPAPSAGDVIVEPPKPPTRDQWWEQADVRARTDWTLAFFVERSGLFDLHDTPGSTPCKSCRGKGTHTRTLSTGKTVTYLCTRCAGVGHDHSIRFR